MLWKKNFYFIVKLIYVWYIITIRCYWYFQNLRYTLYIRVSQYVHASSSSPFLPFLSARYTFYPCERRKGAGKLYRETSRDLLMRLRERGEKEAGWKKCQGTGAGQGIINARVSLTSVGQKSSSGPCLAIERPPGTHRHGDRCVKTISCSPGTLSCLLLSNDSLARSFHDQERQKSCMCKFSRAVSCNFQES